MREGRREMGYYVLVLDVGVCRKSENVSGMVGMETVV